MRLRFQQQIYLWIFVAALSLVVAACGDDDNSGSVPARPTSTPTVSATPTATPLPNENLFGSSQAAGGSLAVIVRPQVQAFLSTCLGGTGDNCTGGTAIWVGTEPGFEEVEEDIPSLSLFALPDGVPITLEIVAIDPAISLQFDDVTLNAAGQTISIGTTPGIHQDLEWHLQLPGGDMTATHSVTFKLTTTSSSFSGSSQYTIPVVPTAGQPPSNDD
ncbi:MAG TPA: hypothetical protein VMT89_10345 [Candidatus Acidoferrales bacterium]|nr:hypothetical protein [Candidatus Acidoferrales bacterium]